MVKVLVLVGSLFLACSLNAMQGGGDICTDNGGGGWSITGSSSDGSGMDFTTTGAGE